MMKKWFLGLCLLCPVFLFAQDFLGDKYVYSYHQENLTPRIELCKNSPIQAYYDSLKSIYDAEMGIVIGEAQQELKVFKPQSPLSNLLTDMVYEYADSLAQSRKNPKVDLTILNFGGIRGNIPQGDITIGTIYSVLSFDNLIVIASMKGGELQKVFKRFTAKYNQPYSHAKVTYLGDDPIEILVNGEKIDAEKTYRVATLDFLVFNNGDGIFDGVTFENIEETNVLFRDILLNYVKKKKVVEAQLDDRVVIKPQR